MKNLNETNTKNTNKVFWAIVFANAVSDMNPDHRKERLGFIIKLFDWDHIKNQLDINLEDLNSVIKADCKKYIDQLNVDNKV